MIETLNLIEKIERILVYKNITDEFKMDTYYLEDTGIDIINRKLENILNKLQGKMLGDCLIRLEGVDQELHIITNQEGFDLSYRLFYFLHKDTNYKESIDNIFKSRNIPYKICEQCLTKKEIERYKWKTLETHLEVNDALVDSL